MAPEFTVVVIVPKLPAVERLAWGPPYCARLNTLEVSARNCSRSFFVKEIFFAKSSCHSPGPRNAFRPRFPNVPSGAANAAGLIQLSGVCPAAGNNGAPADVIGPFGRRNAVAIRNRASCPVYGDVYRKSGPSRSNPVQFHPPKKDTSFRPIAEGKLIHDGCVESGTHVIVAAGLIARSTPRILYRIGLTAPGTPVVNRMRPHVVGGQRKPVLESASGIQLKRMKKCCCCHCLAKVPKAVKGNGAIIHLVKDVEIVVANAKFSVRLRVVL